MSKTIIQHYADFTPKGRLILRVLVDAYSSNGDEGLTRRQIAHALGQARLYPHDDKALKQLESADLIHVSAHRLRDYLAQHWNDASIMESDQIRMYTVIHLHWLNGAYYAPLIRLISKLK